MKNMLKQLCDYKGLDFVTTFHVRKRFRTLEKRAPERTVRVCNNSLAVMHLEESWTSLMSVCFSLYSKAPAKRSQHANATYRNIVGRNMLRAFGHRVATCWLLLAQV